MHIDQYMASRILNFAIFTNFVFEFRPETNIFGINIKFWTEERDFLWVDSSPEIQQEFCSRFWNLYER